MCLLYAYEWKLTILCVCVCVRLQLPLSLLKTAQGHPMVRSIHLSIQASGYELSQTRLNRSGFFKGDRVIE